MMTRTPLWPLALPLLALVASGCTVGPDFHRPAAPEVTAYTATPVVATGKTPSVVGGDAQRFVEGQDISAEWWALFQSPPLNTLVERALAANHDVKAARAALTLAHENVLAQRGAYYPSVTGAFSASRSKTSEELAPTPSSGAFYYSLFTPQLNVSYAADVFGLNRRTVEALQAQQQLTRFELVAAQIALSANVVATAIEEASLRAQVDSTQDLIDSNTRALAVLRQQQQQGYASRLDVAAQEAQLAQVSATLPQLLKQLAQQRDLLAALSGSFPSQGPSEEFKLAQLELPVELPLSLPSRLVEQRPDIRQAEENLHAASAGIGVAVASRLPNILLTADAGQSALTMRDLFSASNTFWDVGVAVSQPIFQGGMLLHKERAARAAYAQADEQYQSTVLRAFQNVADTLSALRHDADSLLASTAAVEAARTTLDLVQKQQRAGYANYLQLLTAEQAYQQTVLTQVQAQANRYADTAALFLALGGGWWNSAEYQPHR
jgi:NodT family efflux transporter outer membrane factor (OMF) lipoprotein